jgi:hypothetical protein
MLAFEGPCEFFYFKAILRNEKEYLMCRSLSSVTYHQPLRCLFDVCAITSERFIKRLQENLIFMNICPDNLLVLSGIQ